MASVRLLLDEDVRPLLAESLRSRGYDAVHASELALRRAGDRDVLEAAVRERRAVLTHNTADFSVLAHEYSRTGRSHWGIVLTQQSPFRVLLSRTLLFLSRTDADSLRDIVRWLPR